jgi:hypothetical protein
MMRFYDQLRRKGQSVDRYEELLVASLDADNDRGAERLLRQTRFLAASYRAYERRLASLTTVDEHGLRSHLIQHAAGSPLRRVVVAVGDWIADPGGLFAVDFDLLTRVSGLEELDVVATSGLLGSGFDQRIHDWLPGLDTVDASSLGVRASLVPTIVAPGREDGVPVWIHRDREEELVAVAGAPQTTGSRGLHGRGVCPAAAVSLPRARSVPQRRWRTRLSIGCRWRPSRLRRRSI